MYSTSLAVDSNTKKNQSSSLSTSSIPYQNIILVDNKGPVTNHFEVDNASTLKPIFREYVQFGILIYKYQKPKISNKSFLMVMANNCNEYTFECKLIASNYTYEYKLTLKHS